MKNCYSVFQKMAELKPQETDPEVSESQKKAPLEEIPQDPLDKVEEKDVSSVSP